MRHFNITVYGTGLNSGRNFSFNKKMQMIDVKIEQVSHKVFQQ